MAGLSLRGCFVGLLLAVPLAAAVRVIASFSLRRYQQSALFTGDGS